MSAPFLPPTAAPTPAPAPADDPMMIALFFTDASSRDRPSSIDDLPRRDRPRDGRRVPTRARPRVGQIGRPDASCTRRAPRGTCRYARTGAGVPPERRRSRRRVPVVMHSTCDTAAPLTTTGRTSVR